MSSADNKIKELVKEVASFDTTIEILETNRKERKKQIMVLLEDFIKETGMLKDVGFSGFIEIGRKGHEGLRFGTFMVKTGDKKSTKWSMDYDTVLRDVFKLFGHFSITVKLGTFTDKKDKTIGTMYLEIGEHDLRIKISKNISKEDFRQIQKEYGFKVSLDNNKSWLKTAKENVEKYEYLNSLPIPGTIVSEEEK